MAPAQISKDRSVAVGLVARKVLGSRGRTPFRIGQADGLQGLLEGRHLVPLPRREGEGERQA